MIFVDNLSELLGDLALFDFSNVWMVECFQVRYLSKDTSREAIVLSSIGNIEEYFPQ